MKLILCAIIDKHHPVRVNWVIIYLCPFQQNDLFHAEACDHMWLHQENLSRKERPGEALVWLRRWKSGFLPIMTHSSCRGEARVLRFSFRQIAKTRGNDCLSLESASLGKKRWAWNRIDCGEKRGAFMANSTHPSRGVKLIRKLCENSKRTLAWRPKRMNQF